jgi:predicted outer membrane repeat protein
MVQYNLALDGPGIALEESNASLKNCTIWSNHADGAGGGMVIFALSAPTLENCVIKNNNSFGSGGGVYINDAFPVFLNCDISNNHGAIGGGTTYSGGGISVKLDSGPYFENCIIQENTSESFGGGIATFSPTQLINCLFANNHATTNGGAVYLGSGKVIESPIYNCTLADNVSPHGSAVTCYNHVAIVRNCILWDQWNQSPNSLIYLGSITALDVADIAYSDIQNGKTSIELWQNASYHWGQDNIDADPQFDTIDFSLTWASPCIEAGTPDTTGLGLPELDLDGLPRIVNTRVDMGAYEYQLPVQIPDSGFRIPDLVRIYPVPAKDFVFVEVPEDYAEGVLQVVNSSGIVVIEEEMTSHFIKINIEDIPPGFYLIRIINDEGIIVQKFLIY